MDFLKRLVWTWVRAIADGLYPRIYAELEQKPDGSHPRNPNVSITLYWDLPDGSFDDQFSSPWEWASLQQRLEQSFEIVYR